MYLEHTPSIVAFGVVSTSVARQLHAAYLCTLSTFSTVVFSSSDSTLRIGTWRQTEEKRNDEKKRRVASASKSRCSNTSTALRRSFVRLSVRSFVLSSFVRSFVRSFVHSFVRPRVFFFFCFYFARLSIDRSIVRQSVARSSFCRPSVATPSRAASPHVVAGTRELSVVVSQRRHGSCASVLAAMACRSMVRR